MNGNAEIVANTYSNVISVTSDAVVEEDSGNWVWLVNGGGKVKKIKVVLGVASVDKTKSRKV